MMYKGYDLELILLRFLIDKNGNISSKHCLRFFLYHDICSIFKRRNVLITSDLEREFYRDLFKKIKLLSEICIEDTYSFDNKSLKSCFSIMNIFRSLTIANRFISFGSKNYLKLSGYICYIMNSIDSLKQLSDHNDVKIKNIFSFMPLHGIESVIAQHIKRYPSTNVYMYQHSLYQYDETLAAIDKILFRNENYQYVDRILLWGKFTRDEMQKYVDVQKLSICGSLVDLEKINYNPDTNSILFLGTSNSYDKFNQASLEYLLAQNDSIIVFFKKHPNSNFEFIHDRVITLPTKLSVKEAILESKCSCGFTVNSTSYYDFYRFGVRCYKFEFPGMRKLYSVYDDDSITSFNDGFPVRTGSIESIDEKISYFYDCNNNYIKLIG